VITLLFTSEGGALHSVAGRIYSQQRSDVMIHSCCHGILIQKGPRFLLMYLFNKLWLAIMAPAIVRVKYGYQLAVGLRNYSCIHIDNVCAACDN